MIPRAPLKECSFDPKLWVRALHPGRKYKVCSGHNFRCASGFNHRPLFCRLGKGRILSDVTRRLRFLKHLRNARIIREGGRP